jgi:hypothetical protein
VPGDGPLTAARVISHAAGMLRQGVYRVGAVALLVFIPPALLSELVQESAEDIDIGDDPVKAALVVLAVLLVIVFKLLGPVAYAGYLDAAVGDRYFHGSDRSIGEVIRSLPLSRLLVADIALVLAVTIGLGLLVVPGLVIGTLFGLVGPVIVQERRTLVDAFRRTARISRPAWRLILLLVVIPIGLEHTVEEVVLERAHEIHPLAEVVAEWVLAVTVGALVGLLEVAIATELMARTPESQPVPPAVDSPAARSSLL